MVEREFEDRAGKLWKVTETLVGAGARGKGDPFPETGPWLNYKLKDGSEEYSGPSSKRLEQMSETELRERLDDFRSEL